MSNFRLLSKGRVAAAIIIAVLIVDQVVKLWVKTSMALGESIRVTDWFYIYFIENNGMAYGMQIGSKLALSLFRLGAIAALSWYICRLVRKQQAKWGYVVCLAMVLAGAAGNLIDCMFYGLCFNESAYNVVSHYVGFGEGYAPFLMGKVVDMLYFPLIETNYPEWFPWWGGQRFIFFSPIFNIADSSISVGVVALLLFYRKEVSQLTIRDQGGEGEKEIGEMKRDGEA